MKAYIRLGTQEFGLTAQRVWLCSVG